LVRGKKSFSCCPAELRAASLKFARDRESAKVLETLSFLVFRRWWRLILPSVALTFIGFLLMRLDPFRKLPPGWDYHQLANLPAPVGSFTWQIWYWLKDARQLVHPFRHGQAYNSPFNDGILWTVQIELMDSMFVFVFVTVLSLARTRTRARTQIEIAILSILITSCHYNIHWDTFLFLSGALLAELSLTREFYATRALFSLHSDNETEPQAHVSHLFSICCDNLVHAFYHTTLLPASLHLATPTLHE
jgi:hypothetical protein